jgi:ABC-type glycerol-3-phosphate transport system permease component
LSTKLISIVLASMAAYAVSRLDFTGKALILSGALAVAMFPPISIVGSLFDMWRAIGIYDTWPGLIIPYMTFTLPLAIYTLSAFFREIPWELEQAAQVDGATPFQAFRKIIIPLAGMIVGNTMTATTLAANRFLGELRQQQHDVESMLALGATSRQAASEVVREALRAALIPSIAGMMIVGIAALPGMMTGQVLAGQDPTQAVRYQIVVQYMIMFSAVATSLMIVRLLHRRYFTPDHQLELAVIRQAPRQEPENSLVDRVNRFIRGSS